MIEITIYDRDSDDILDIVRELKTCGAIQHSDFDFSFVQEKRDWYDNIQRQKHTVFKFYNDYWSTWFTLKFL